METKELCRIITDFRNERDWSKFHNGKDLALSLNLEAGELLEIFQWSGSDLECLPKLGKIKEELADVLMYCFLLADHYGLNPEEIIKDKLLINAAHYPVDKAKGSSKKYNEL